MNLLYILIGVISIIAIYYIIRTPTRFIRLLGYSAVRLTIGILFLFFFNVFGGSIGLHIPINVFTVLVSSILGLFGVTSLAAIHIFIL